MGASRLACIACALAGSAVADSSLVVSLVDAPPTGDTVMLAIPEHDTGGNTSVANDTRRSIKHTSLGSSGYYLPKPGVPPAEWREVAYVKRSRDLGQTFTYDGRAPRRLDAITLRTGYGSNIVRPNTFGRAVSLQLFEVTGEPTLHDNGTREPDSAAHGFPHRIGEAPPQRDDYFVGETYRSIAIARGGAFPRVEAFGLPAGASPRPDAEALRGRLLRFDLRGEAEVTLLPGRRYAFVVMIDTASAGVGFTLANRFDGEYADGHGIRRSGDGTLPPPPADPSQPIDAPANRDAAAAALLPVDFAVRTALSPGTRGFPDVDTHRDLTFFVEANPVD